MIALAMLAVATLLEAESFNSVGGWSIDQQFMDQMGSPYLLAHGLGRPVADAVTKAKLPGAGKYRLWVRTRDWVKPYGAGEFQVLIDGKVVGNFGKGGSGEWDWWDGGIVTAANREITVVLHDLSGFEGRVDALCFMPAGETKPPPNTIDFKWRSPLLGNPKVTPVAGEYDFCVVGGGFAGMCAAVAAARAGASVALVQDRGVYGGNGSEEVRVHPLGKWGDGEFKRNRELMEEILKLIPKHQGPAWIDNYKPDSVALERWVAAEPKVTRYVWTRAVGVEKKGGSIAAITIRDVKTGRERIVRAKLFADCTGDGWLGMASGAETKWDPGWNGRGLGSTISWASSNTNSRVSFPACPWACKVEKPEDALPPYEQKRDVVDGGNWDWESGFFRDPVKEGEAIRDLNLRGIWGWWDFAKNRSDKKRFYENRVIYWLGYVLGKRDAHRIVGDYVLTEEDLVQHRVYEDGVVDTTWFIDLHKPYGEFRTVGCNDAVEVGSYPIPYRCFYSKDVTNLFMAGKNISGTYRALASYRVEKTTAMMGTVVGRAAALCARRNWSPRELGRDHFEELKCALR